MNKQQTQAERRAARTRGKVVGSTDRPRLSVHRTNEFIYAQIIDDTMGKTLFSLSEKAVKATGTKTEKAKALGLEVAKLAAEKKIKQVVFDKGSYQYHGRVKALAEGAREGGLVF